MIKNTKAKNGAGKMNRITPELHTFKWSPKTKSKEDLELVKVLEQLVKDQNITKTQLTRKALNDFVKKNEKMYSDVLYGSKKLNQSL